MFNMFIELFTGGDALKKVKNPREYRYVKVLRFKLGLIGSWPGGQLGEKHSKYGTVLAHVLLCMKIICGYLGVIYIMTYHTTIPFLEVGHNYITILMTCVTISRLSTLSINKKFHVLLKKFFTQFHLFYSKDESDFALETHVKVHKISSFFCVYINFLIIFGVILFNLLPLYNNYKNNKFDKEHPNNITYQFAVYYKLPFDTLYSFEGYLVVSIFNWYTCYICSNVFCMFDLVLFVLIFHVRGNFEILLHTLNNFPKPATCVALNINEKDRLFEQAQLYNETEMVEIEKKLKSCIDKHRKLITFTQEISTVFGPMLFVYFTFNQISDCLLLLEISQMNAEALVRYGPLTLALFQQLIQLSFIIESIGTVTGKLKDAVYNVPWEFMDTKNRKTVMIFMMNVAEPVHMNALGLVKVGVTTMASIFKTSFSYFAFLRSVAE